MPTIWPSHGLNLSQPHRDLGELPNKCATCESHQLQAQRLTPRPAYLRLQAACLLNHIWCVFLEGSHMGESMPDSSVWTHPGLHSQSSRAELLLFLSRCSLLHVLCVAVLLRATLAAVVGCCGA